MTAHDPPVLPPGAPASGPNAVVDNMQEWLPRLAHDLRSPLVAIGYASQMLRSGRAPPRKVDELFATTDRKIAQLGKLAEEIGDMLLIGRERFVMRQGQCDLVSIVREALQETTHGAGRAANHVGGNAVGVLCDRARLVQLLRHLVRLTGKRKPGAALPDIAIEAGDGHVQLRIHDPAAAIYLGDALEHLAHGTAPQDPGVLCMSDIIARRILLAHGATLVVGECTDQRTTSLTLILPTS